MVKYISHTVKNTFLDLLVLFIIKTMICLNAPNIYCSSNNYADMLVKFFLQMRKVLGIDQHFSQFWIKIS